MAKGSMVPVGNDNDEDDWQAQSDLRAMMDAHKVKSNPARHAKAKAHAKRMLKAVGNPFKVAMGGK